MRSTLDKFMINFKKWKKTNLSRLLGYLTKTEYEI